MKLAVIGNKEFTDRQFFYEILTKIKNITKIISGGAPGTDTLAKQYSEANNIEFIEFSPNYDLHGIEAKQVRDKKIVENCDSILAFWDGICEGTGYTIEYARKLHKPVKIIRVQLSGN